MRSLTTILSENEDATSTLVQETVMTVSGSCLFSRGPHWQNNSPHALHCLFCYSLLLAFTGSHILWNSHFRW